MQKNIFIKIQNLYSIQNNMIIYNINDQKRDQEINRCMTNGSTKRYDYIYEYMTLSLYHFQNI